MSEVSDTDVDITVTDEDEDIEANDSIPTDCLDKPDLINAKKPAKSRDLLHHFIIRYDEKDLNIKVDKKTALLLQNDHNYAEQFVSSLMKSGAVGSTSFKTTSEVIPSTIMSSGAYSKMKKKKIAAVSQGIRETWTIENTKLLVDVRLSMEEEFCDTTKSEDLLWTKVAEEVTKLSKVKISAEKCHVKFRAMMNIYQGVLTRANATNKEPTWAFYSAFFEFYGDLPIKAKTDGTPPNKNDAIKKRRKKCWTDADTWVLLSKRLAMEDEFANSEGDNSDLWDTVSEEVNINPKKGPYSGQSCKSRWFLLLVQYRQKIDPATSDTERKGWPYFEVLHKTFNGIIPDKEDVDQREKAIGWGARVTNCLLQTRIDMEDEFTNPSFKKQDLWVKVAEIVNSTADVNLTGSDCLARFRNAWRTYTHNLDKIATYGQAPIWIHFDTMHKAFHGHQQKLRTEAPDGHTFAPASMKNLWSDRNIKLLIKCRLELEHKFVSRKLKVATLWFHIAKKLNTVLKTKLFTWSLCHLQWRKLRLDYDEIIEKQNITGKSDKSWPYFDLFHKIYDGQPYQAIAESACNGHRVTTHDVSKEVDSADEPEPNLDNDLEMPEADLTLAAPLISTPSQASTSKGSNSEGLPLKRKKSTRKEDELYDLEQQGESAQTRGEASTGRKVKGWFKHMLADWKKERLQRWEEKKHLEREKIKAINNLTKTILSLEPDIDTDMGYHNKRRRMEKD